MTKLMEPTDLLELRRAIQTHLKEREWDITNEGMFVGGSSACITAEKDDVEIQITIIPTANDLNKPPAEEQVYVGVMPTED